MEWLAMALAPGEARKDLSADALFGSLRSRFASLPDPRSGEVEIPLADALMSAFAMFSLKDPSLLAFDHRRHNPNDNFRTIYGINRVPCDSQMRDILDPIDPANLRAPFREVFRRLQRGQVLKRFVYLDGHYLLSLDGTTYFSSSKIHCSSCLEKHHRNGSVSYYHQLLGATLVHPDLKEVIPLAPEPIIQQDGQTKNDCERNATRRWLKRFRQEHPHLPVIVVEDALSANAPHLRDLREAGTHYIIGVKPGDHAFLFAYLQTLDEAGQMQVLTLEDPATGVVHHFRFCNGVPLNESNPDESVNVLEYWEIHPDGKVQHFSWITDFLLIPENVWDIMRGGRARWKIENETFNTLKTRLFRRICGRVDGRGIRLESEMSHPGAPPGQDGVTTLHRDQENPKMRIQTILNRVEKFKSFVYGAARLEELQDGPALLVQVRPRKNGLPCCSRCG